MINHHFRFANAFGFVQNSPILKLTASYYGVDNNAVVWLSNVYYVTYILFGMLSIKPLQIRLDYSLFFAVSLNTIGIWNLLLFLRWMAQILCWWWLCFSFCELYVTWNGIIVYTSSTCLFIYDHYPLDVADKWFPANERTFATSIGSFIN